MFPYINMKKTQKNEKKRLTDQKKPKYECKICDFNTSNKTDHKRHLKTKKHMKLLDSKKGVSKSLEKNAKCVFFKQYFCKCSRAFKTRSGLWKHKKTCQKNENLALETGVSKCFQKTQNVSCAYQTDNTNSLDDQIKLLTIEKLKNENKKLEKEMKNLNKPISTTFLTNEIVETIGKIAGNNNNNYNNTNNISINMYLNQNCKNAMSLEDFVKQINISLQDLAFSKQNGYVKGIANIFIKQLQDLKPTERPIYCSDKKRLKFYVKDDNTWKKDKNNVKITKSIKNVGLYQVKKLSEWEKLNPTFQEDSKLLSEWQKTLNNITAGTSAEEIHKNEEKIKKELCKVVDIKPKANK